jgi:translation initiation factor IF-2
MRQHGATVTDVIILVVAATEGVRPQTKECIRLAKQANVPIVVAINKCDLHDANSSRTREELLQVVMAAMGGLKLMSIACVFERCVSFDDEFHNIF